MSGLWNIASLLKWAALLLTRLMKDGHPIFRFHPGFSVTPNGKALIAEAGHLPNISGKYMRIKAPKIS